MKLIDQQYLATPFYGARKITAWLKSKNKLVNRKHVRRLMRIMGIRAIYRRPRTSKPAPGNKIYPYLLRGLEITRTNQVWCADITYIPMARGFMYLVAIMDWYSRYVLSWRLSNTMDSDFCVEALKDAMRKGKPEIFNTENGVQLNGEAYKGKIKQHEINLRIEGKASYNDNLFIERLWRSVKYEEVYLKAYQDGREARIGIGNYFRFYNAERPHQILGYRTPAEVFFGNSIETNERGMVVSSTTDLQKTAELSLNSVPILSN